MTQPFVSGQYGPEAQLVDVDGAAFLVKGASIRVPIGYSDLLDAEGNLTITGPAIDSLVGQVRPAGSSQWIDFTVRVLPLVAELPTRVSVTAASNAAAAAGIAATSAGAVAADAQAKANALGPLVATAEADAQAAATLAATANAKAGQALTALPGKADLVNGKLAPAQAPVIPDAGAQAKGLIKLAGALAGSADAPTVPGLAAKANTADVVAKADLTALQGAPNGLATLGADGLLTAGQRAGGSAGVAASAIKAALRAHSLGTRASGDQVASAALANASYRDDPVIQQNWTNATADGWTLVATQGQAATHGLYSTGPGGLGLAYKAYPVGPKEFVRMKGQVYLPAKGSGTTAGTGVVGAGFNATTGTGASPAFADDAYFGIDVATGQLSLYAKGQSVAVGPPLPFDVLYEFTVTVDEFAIGFCVTHLNDTNTRRETQVARTGKLLNLVNLLMINSDSRGVPTAAGQAAGITTIAVRKGSASILPRQEAAAGAGYAVPYKFEGVQPSTTRTTIGADKVRMVLPVNYDSRYPSPLIVLCHQYETEIDSQSNTPLGLLVTKAIADAGYILVMTDAGNQDVNDNAEQFSDETAVYAYANAYRYAALHANVGPVVLGGFSMGGAASHTLLSRDEVPGVCGIFGFSPLVNVKNLVVDNPIQPYTNAAKAAYGISIDNSNAVAALAGRDPVSIDPTLYRGVRARYYVGDADPLVSTALNAGLLASQMAPYSPEVTVINQQGGGHLDPTGFQRDDFMSFLFRCRNIS